MALAPVKRFAVRTTRLTIHEAHCHLLVPESFMNTCGPSITRFAEFHRIEPAQLLVAHDELDLPVGSVQLKIGGGSGGHNGLRDLIRLIGPDFARLRIGIGHPGRAELVTGYVLSRPTPDERTGIDRAIERALPVFPQLLAGDFAHVMQTLHTES